MVLHLFIAWNHGATETVIRQRFITSVLMADVAGWHKLGTRGETAS